MAALGSTLVPFAGPEMDASSAWAPAVSAEKAKDDIKTVADKLIRYAIRFSICLGIRRKHERCFIRLYTSPVHAEPRRIFDASGTLPLSAQEGFDPWEFRAAADRTGVFVRRP